MAYTVLARKYRPQTLSELIGQDTLVKVLTNSFKLNRIAHSFLLTGSRGIGKTSTARIIAKGLNCLSSSNNNLPTVDPCGECESCISITESRHIDVIEMDAASRTGVSDVREIIDNIDYKTVYARFKVYIIDEVHMLSNSAFNALLKTLEEPPAHVKFIFATTEILKIPTTIISRCQRFDLERINNHLIINHLSDVCIKEKISFSESALRMISDVSEGSIRDALSILDQAIIYSDGKLEANHIIEMLGLLNQNRSLELFEIIIEQKNSEILTELEEEIKDGIDPFSIVNGLMDINWKLMVSKIKKEKFIIYDLSDDNLDLLQNLSKKMSIGILSRCWQILLKIHEEMKYAPDILSTLQMGLLRLSFFSNSPDHTEFLNFLENSKNLVKENIKSYDKNNIEKRPVSNDNINLEKKKIEINNFNDLLILLKKEKKIPLLVELETNFKMLSFKSGEIQFDLTPDASIEIVSKLSNFLYSFTNIKWDLIRLENTNAKTLSNIKEEKDIKLKKLIDDNDIVQEIIKKFPGSKIAKSSFH
ncbi:MAG: DNA polymerase III subunit gamma/tau [Paracoccaceae bacterium]